MSEPVSDRERSETVPVPRIDYYPCDKDGRRLAAMSVTIYLPEGVVEAACEVMHDAYERAAVGAGWETQRESRKPWADVPEANKITMRAAVSALFDWLASGPERTT